MYIKMCIWNVDAFCKEFGVSQICRYESVANRSEFESILYKVKSTCRSAINFSGFLSLEDVWIKIFSLCKKIVIAECRFNCSHVTRRTTTSTSSELSNVRLCDILDYTSYVLNNNKSKRKCFIRRRRKACDRSCKNCRICSKNCI